MHTRATRSGNLSASIALLLALATSSADAGIIVASNTPAADGAVYGVGYTGTFAAAQTFTTTAGGTLESVSMRFAANGSVPNSIAVDFYGTGAGGTPASLLGTAVVPSPSLGAILGWYTADFASLGISLLGGTSYAIRARPGAPGGIDIGAATSNTYGGGVSWTSIDSGATWTASPYGYDISFVVTAVPEPGTLALCCLALIGLAPIRARNLRGNGRQRGTEASPALLCTAVTTGALVT